MLAAEEPEGDAAAGTPGPSALRLPESGIGLEPQERGCALSGGPRVAPRGPPWTPEALEDVNKRPMARGPRDEEPVWPAALIDSAI